jgi:uncharacterized protein with HEPN domain
MARQITERDIDSLLLILDHCERINACVSRFGDDYDIYYADPDYKDAVKMNLLQIGEISNRLSEECTGQIPDVPWREIYGLRNVIAHGYESLVEERIWNTVKKDIPQLSQTLDRILSELGEI